MCGYRYREALDAAWPAEHKELTIAMGMGVAVTDAAPRAALGAILDAVNLMCPSEIRTPNLLIQPALCRRLTVRISLEQRLSTSRCLPSSSRAARRRGCPHSRP